MITPFFLKKKIQLSPYGQENPFNELEKTYLKIILLT